MRFLHSKSIKVEHCSHHTHRIVVVSDRFGASAWALCAKGLALQQVLETSNIVYVLARTLRRLDHGLFIIMTLWYWSLLRAAHELGWAVYVRFLSYTFWNVINPNRRILRSQRGGSNKNPIGTLSELRMRFGYHSRRVFCGFTSWKLSNYPIWESWLPNKWLHFISTGFLIGINCWANKIMESNSVDGLFSFLFSQYIFYSKQSCLLIFSLVRSM